MSIDFPSDVLHIPREKYIKIFSVDTKKQETLAEFIKRVRDERKLSIIDVEVQSRKGGRKGISNGYLSQIENGFYINVSTNKLKAIALGLGVTEEEIFAVARGSRPKSITVAEERFAILASGYDGLTEQEKTSIEPLLETIENVIRKSEKNRKAAEREPNPVGRLTIHELKRPNDSTAHRPAGSNLEAPNFNVEINEVDDIPTITIEELRERSMEKNKNKTK